MGFYVQRSNFFKHVRAKNFNLSVVQICLKLTQSTEQITPS